MSGLAPGLRASGSPGDRTLKDNMGMPVLTEQGGAWIPVMTSGSWDRWRQIAQAILDTDIAEAEAG